jgi:hypothetical protein
LPNKSLHRIASLWLAPGELFVIPKNNIFSADRWLKIVLLIILGGEHMTILIREARSEDASFLAWVMLTATRSHLSYGLWEHFVGGSEEECVIPQDDIPHKYAPFISS